MVNITVKTFKVIIDSSKCSTSCDGFISDDLGNKAKDKAISACLQTLRSQRILFYSRDMIEIFRLNTLCLIWDSIMCHKQFRCSFLALITANELLCRGAHDSNATIHLLIEAFYTKKQSSKTNNANCNDRPPSIERHLETVEIKASAWWKSDHR